MALISTVLGSDRKHGPLSYIFLHCLPTGFQSAKEAFYFWSLAIQDDTREYEGWDFLSEEEKLENVRLDFWHSLSEPEIVDRETLNWMAECS